jgi:hypothetical protein
VGIDAQQAPDEAQEFGLAAAVNLLRITESAGKPAVLPRFVVSAAGAPLRGTSADQSALSIDRFRLMICEKSLWQ